MNRLLIIATTLLSIFIGCNNTKKDEPLPEPEQLIYEDIQPSNCYDFSFSDYEKGLCDILFKDRFVVKNLVGIVVDIYSYNSTYDYAIVNLDEISYKSMNVDRVRFPYCGNMSTIRIYNMPKKLKQTLKKDIKVKIDINLFYSDGPKSGQTDSVIPCTPADLLRLEILK